MANRAASQSDRRRRLKRRLAISTALVVVAIACCIWHEPIFRAGGRWLDVGVVPDHCDYVMVLMGGEETRPFAAAELYRAGLVENFVVALIERIESQAGSLAPKPDEVVTTILHARGVPIDRIQIIGKPANSTRDEIISLGQLMEQHPNAEIGIVTSDFHTRRTRWTVQQLLGPARYARVQMISAPTDDYNADNWWQHDAGFSIYVREFIKLGVFYWCRDGAGLLWIGLGAIATGLFVRYVW